MILVRDPQGKTHLYYGITNRLHCDRSPHGMVAVQGERPTCTICAIDPEEDSPSSP